MADFAFVCCCVDRADDNAVANVAFVGFAAAIVIGVAVAACCC